MKQKEAGGGADEKPPSPECPRSGEVQPNDAHLSLQPNGFCGGRATENNALTLSFPIFPLTAMASTTTLPPSLSAASVPHRRRRHCRSPFAKLDISEVMGGRGLLNGEKGLKLFIQNNPPPTLKSSDDTEIQLISSKPKPPELPLFLPGMIVIVKNKANPFYMYTGIVQRVTDGKAGVLFEGGNWDRLITFNLGELERREKGPPGVNPRSAALESMIESLAVAEQ